MDKQGNPLRLPLEWVKQGGFQHATQDIALKLKNNYWTKAEEASQLKRFGLNNWNDLSNPKLAKRIQNWKAFIMLADLGALAFCNQFVYRFRNWYTEKRTKRKGYVGEFNYTTHKYTKETSKAYDQNKSKRDMVSIISGFGGALLLPALMLGAMRKKGNQGLLGWFKETALPKLNYTNAIFMGRWVMLYQLVTSYDIPKLMLARDGHELREDLIEMAYFNALYFLGDELIASLKAKPLQKKLGAALEGVSLTKSFKLFGREWKASRSLPEIYEQVGENRDHPAFKAGKNIFLTGLIGSSAIMAAITLMNYAITRHKVSKDMQVLNQKIVAHMARLAGKQSEISEPMWVGSKMYSGHFNNQLAARA